MKQNVNYSSTGSLKTKSRFLQRMNRYFSSNYAYTDSNFVIMGLPRAKVEHEKIYSVLCVLQNLIQRGTPTSLSPYLAKDLTTNNSEEYLHLFSEKTPHMQVVIKGNDREGINPASVFYHRLLTNCFPQYPFLPQLFIPEVPLTEIVQIQDSDFAEQAVDFYCPTAKLVLEIDGSQHENSNQAFLDRKRDRILETQGVQVCRIKTKDLNERKKLQSLIWPYLSGYKDMLDRMALDYERCKDIRPSDYNAMKCAATMRLQIAIIELCKSGVLSLNDEEWHLIVIGCEVQEYEFSAIEDLFKWLKPLCTLADIPFHEPLIFIHDNENDADCIKIKMSLLQKPTPENTRGNYDLFIHTAWRQDVNYYQVSTANKIEYMFENSDMTGLLKNTHEEFSINKKDALKTILNYLFGFDDFRPGQERIIMNALGLNDTIGLLPTGSGKSLCYQIASMLQPCVSFVVCPIKSLMIDQDQNLKNVNITRTQFLSSDLSAQERETVQREYASLRYWWVFLSPERFQSTSFREYLLSLSGDPGFQFGYGVIDEVHCMSEWGHSFRVSYLNLVNTIRNYCPAITLLGLTATASYNVLKNVMIEFQMKDRSGVISIPSFTRSELDFEVITTHSDKYSVLKAILDRYQKFYPDLLKGEKVDRTGIVFTTAVNAGTGCFELSKKLAQDYGADVRFYSGTKPKKWTPDGSGQESFDLYKREVQDEFKTDQFPLLIATKAFGMGIDKPNIRYTIHYGLPSSLEALYQEAGRAGRDRKKARCSVIYNPEDKETALEVERVLSQYSTAKDMQDFLQKKRWDLNDVGIHLFFMNNDLKTDEEVYSLDTEILNKYLQNDTGQGVDIYSVDLDISLGDLQKAIYHLSIIGVVKDWTVDWKTDSVHVFTESFTDESVYLTTEKYIQNYEPEYRIEVDEKNMDDAEAGFGALPLIEKALHIFWDWYKRSIIYSRKEALKNTIEACDEYDPKRAEEFKSRMEAYFKLDDVADAFGILADNPGNIDEWFNALNLETIEKNGLKNMVINMNRFLESYNNNTALNYISGLLNLMTGRFETFNGERRFVDALSKINKYDYARKSMILTETLKIIKNKADSAMKEIFSECLLNNFSYDDLDSILYHELEDNVSLSRVLDRSFNRLEKVLKQIVLEEQ